MVDRTVELDRRRIRRTFEERFSVERMVDEYEELYQALATRGEVKVYSRPKSAADGSRRRQAGAAAGKRV